MTMTMDKKVFKVTEDQELNNFVKYTKNYIIVSDVDDKLISLHKAIKWLKGEFSANKDDDYFLFTDSERRNFIKSFIKAMSDGKDM